MIRIRKLGELSVRSVLPVELPQMEPDSISFLTLITKLQSHLVFCIWHLVKKLLLAYFLVNNWLSFLSRDAGRKCPVDNEHVDESQVIIDNSKVLDTTY